ncbi:hypothetical protein EON73_01895 [bacterium]|nr:MAG: hypothetical protein EON73_01895 [bacterium]
MTTEEIAISFLRTLYQNGGNILKSFDFEYDNYSKSANEQLDKSLSFLKDLGYITIESEIRPEPYFASFLGVRLTETGLNRIKEETQY